MPRTWSKPIISAIAVIAMVVFGNAMGFAQERPAAKVIEIGFEGGLLSVKAKDAGIAELMHAISIKSGFPIEVNPDVQGTVNIEFERLGLEDGIGRILDFLGQKNFAVEYARRTLAGSSGTNLAIEKIQIVKRGVLARDQAAVPKQISEEQKSILLEALKNGTQDREDWAFMELLKAGKSAGPLLLEALEIDKVRVKLGTIQIAGLLGIREAVPQMIKLTESTDPYVQQAAIQGLGELGDSRVTKPLMGLYGKDVNATVKRVIIKALRTLGDDSAIPFLEARLADDDKTTQMFAAGALGAFGNKKGFDLAMNYSREGDARLKSAAVAALGLIGDERAVAVIRDINEKSDGELKMMSHLALRLIEMKGKSPDEKVEILKADVVRRDPVGMWAIDEVRKIGNQKAIDVLRNNVKDAKGNIRRDITTSLSALGAKIGK